MKTNINLKLLLFFWMIFSMAQLLAHPTGNLITVGENTLWSYISPVDDIQHHACVMIQKPGSKPEILIKSEFPASDYMLFNKEDDIYMIERKYVQSTRKTAVRILKTQIEGEPVEIWPWFEDNWRIGEGGFFMTSDQHIIFGRFPNVYSLTKNGKPSKYFDFHSSINKIRAVANDQILLLGEKACWLVKQNGEIIKEWNDLIDKTIKNAPLNRNQLFDADYKDGELLLAYWGKRSFEVMGDNGIQVTILQLNEPLVPHWVAFSGQNMLLFSSKLIFNGETPRPNLVLMNSECEFINLWKE